jgi:ethanolamine utilization protein EutQ (cupin superfamily)
MVVVTANAPWNKPRLRRLIAIYQQPADSQNIRNGAMPMTVRKFALSDATFERSPGQDADIFAANLVDQRDGGPVTIGYGRYGPGQSLEATIAVHDTMVILEGGLSVTSDAGAVTAGPGEIVYMPKGSKVTIRAGEKGAVTAYVTYPHWQEAEA